MLGPASRPIPLLLLLSLACTPPSASDDEASGSGSDESGSDESGSGESGSETGEPLPELHCEVERPFPYPSPMSYVGVHAGPGNDDLVPCSLPGTWTQGWSALEGYAIAQPNTFSPDGRTTYVTTSQPTPDACTIWALDSASGQLRWCLAVPGTLFATLEVDREGNLYASSEGSLLSWDAAGNERWATSIPGDDPERNATGVHFDASGRLVTVTDAGLVLLVARETGSVLASLDLPATYGFVPPASLGLDLDFDAMLPQAVRDDFARLFGESGIGAGLGKFAGGSGDFSDNTVGIAPDGTLYVVGGGPDEDHGALVQVRVSGSADAPTLSPGWFVELVASSASSPSVSADGAWVKVSDGNNLAGFLQPSSVEANAHLIDVAACDRNLDGEPEPERCLPARTTPLLSGPALGASPVFVGGESWRWEVQFAALYDQSAPDLVHSTAQGEELGYFLPDDRVWSSVLTITSDYVIGTMTALTPSDAQLVTITLPATASSEVVVVARESGEIVFRAPVSDDSTSTVTVGPDGGLYVTQLALLHALARDTEAVGGLIKFDYLP